MPQLIDLSVGIEPNYSEPDPPKIEFINHTDGAEIFSQRFNENKKRFFGDQFPDDYLQPGDFPGGEFLANEIVTAGVHSGTHMDAPSHYGSTCEGKPARTIDQIPLEWCYGDGVVLDFTWKSEKRGQARKKEGKRGQARNYESISALEIKQALDQIKYKLKSGDIVLIHTGADKLWGTRNYFTDFPGMSREAVQFLIDCGIKVMGIDSYGFDRPFPVMVKDYFTTRDPRVLWEAHFLGREAEYIHMERLANLEELPRSTGFKIACFPIKIKGAGAGWVRCVAIIDEEPETLTQKNTTTDK
jgi:kynurenine formamidase